MTNSPSPSKIFTPTERLEAGRGAHAQEMTLDPKKSRYRFVIAGIILLFNLFYGANFSVITPVMPLVIEEYDIGRGAASFLVSGVLIAQALFVIPGGMLAAKAPLRLVFAGGCVVAAAMALTFLAEHFAALLVLRLIYAMAFVVVMPATAPILMRWFNVRELPVMNSLHMTFFTLGIAVGTFTSGPLSLAIGWQTTFVLFGTAMLIVGALWLAFGRVPSLDAEGKVRRVSLREMAMAVRFKTVLLLGLADGAAFAHYLALTTWLPTYYNEVFGMSLTKAGSIVGIISVVGVIGSLTGGFLSARLGVRKPFLVIPGAMVGLAGVGSYLFQNEAIIYAAVIVLGFGSFLYLPVLLTVPMELKGISEGQVAVAWATMFAVASGIAIIGPMTVGFMTDGFGSFVPGFILWAVLSLGLLVVGLMVPETGPRARLSRR